MRLKDIITEGLSPVLYHFTSFENATNAIEEDMLFGEMHLSLTRSIAGQFHYIRMHDQYGVLFKIDGKKLNNQVTGTPVGGWEYRHDAPGYVKNNPVYKTISAWDGDITYMNGKDNEAHEIIEKPMKSLKSVTILIYIYIPDKNYIYEGKDEILEFYSMAASHGYNIKFIIEKGMLMANGKKSMTYEQFMQYIKKI